MSKRIKKTSKPRSAKVARIRMPNAPVAEPQAAQKAEDMKVTTKTDSKTCSLCDKPAVSRGLCANHYQQDRIKRIKTGDLVPKRRNDGPVSIVAHAPNPLVATRAKGRVGSMDISVPARIMPAVELLAAKERLDPKDWCASVIERAVQSEIRGIVAALGLS